MVSVRKVFVAVCVLLCFAGASFAADIALTSAGQSPDAMMVRVVLKKLGVEPVGSSQAEFTTHIANETKRWAEVAQKANVKIE